MNKTSVVAFRVDKEIYRRMKEALPRKGDRSRILSALVEAFLDKEITISISTEGAKTCQSHLALGARKKLPVNA